MAEGLDPPPLISRNSRGSRQLRCCEEMTPVSTAVHWAGRGRPQTVKQRRRLRFGERDVTRIEKPRGASSVLLGLRLESLLRRSRRRLPSERQRLGVQAGCQSATEQENSGNAFRRGPEAGHHS